MKPLVVLLVSLIAACHGLALREGLSSWNDLLQADGIIPTDLDKISAGMTINNPADIITRFTSLLTPSNVERLYDNFMHRFSNDTNGRAEGIARSVRQAIFSNNLVDIVRHNLEQRAGLRSWTMGVNRFADLTSAEKKAYTGVTVDPSLLAPAVPATRALFLRDLASSLAQFFDPLGLFTPTVDNFDWRDQGIITPVKDQKQCGSCGLFAATALVEATRVKQLGANDTSYERQLSEQYLVDCARVPGKNLNGCNGSGIGPTFDWLRDHGITKQSEYDLYTGTDHQCNAQKSQSACLTKINDWAVVSPRRDERKLKTSVVTNGPHVVTFKVCEDLFKYKSGIYSTQCTDSNKVGMHGLLLVGYGTEKPSGSLLSNDYWTLKNSWGTVWGEQGFFRLGRNKGNLCGVADAPIYVTGGVSTCK